MIVLPKHAPGRPPAPAFAGALRFGRLHTDIEAEEGGVEPLPRRTTGFQDQRHAAVTSSSEQIKNALRSRIRQTSEIRTSVTKKRTSRDLEFLRHKAGRRSNDSAGVICLDNPDHSARKNAYDSYGVLA